MATEAEIIAGFLDLMKGIGPKSVQTPNMTVVMHDPKDVQSVIERRTAPTTVSMCGIKGCVGVPKQHAYDMPEIHKHNNDCGCG